MRARRKFQTHTAFEFELDLAPLLSVMVKLVPVLLLSSAFVQIMTVETDLPQAVREAMSEPTKDNTNVQVRVLKDQGMEVVVQKGEAQSRKMIPMVNGKYDYTTLHLALRTVKTENPDIFRLEIEPDAGVAYKEIVKVMDEARRSRDRSVTFPLFDKKENKTIMTDYMFPDVVFSNVMDG